MMMFRRALVMLVLTSVISSLCAVGDVASIDDVLEPIRAQENVPAIAAAVVRGDEIIAAGAVGVAEFGKDEPVTLDSLFHVGSCTKAMTATMIAALIEDGEMDWDTTVADIMPGISDVLDPAAAKITVHQLMTHTAGLPAFTARGPSEMQVLSRLEGSPMEQRRQFLETLLTKPLDDEPGTKMVYSNADYGILAALAETKTGIAWQDLMKMKLFAPAKMPSADFGWPRDEKHPKEPLGHWQRGEGNPAPHPPDSGYRLDQAIAPAGDAHCTVQDFARFAMLHLNGLRDKDSALKSATIKKLHEPALDSYACGWVERSFGDTKVSWHNGSAGTFFAWMTVAPERNMAIVVVTNSGGGENACKLATMALLKKFAADAQDSTPADDAAPTDAEPAVP